jgi:hypothetical protein
MISAKGPDTRTKDLAASIRARLAAQAQAANRPFQELLTHFTLERFLYRLSRSRHASRFILKGGLLLRALEGPLSRPTRDVDLLGHGDPSVDEIVSVMRDLCLEPVAPDGLRFDPDSVRGDLASGVRSSGAARGCCTTLRRTDSSCGIG